MKIIVVDLENCQPSGKIIQIGASVWDLKRGIELGKFDMYANPQELPSQYITDLTGITQENIASAYSLAVVLSCFWNWCEKQNCGMQLGAWGGDVYELIEASKAEGIWHGRKFPKVLNIKEYSKVVRAALPQSKKSGGLRNSMEVMGLTFEGLQHRAYIDAWNTGKLLNHYYQLNKLGINVLKLSSEITDK